MEVFFAFMVLGCALLLTFITRASSGGKMSNIEQIVNNSRTDSSETSPTDIFNSPQADLARKQELLQAVAQDPDSVTDTLRQWLRE